MEFHQIPHQRRRLALYEPAFFGESLDDTIVNWLSAK